MNTNAKVLDACCGSRMFWFNKGQQGVIFQDIREVNEILADGRKLEVKPNHLGDFTNMDFANETFSLVIFDPPHLVRAGERSMMAKKYGVLNKETWRDDLKKGFDECWRVLKIGGTMVMKWSEVQIRTAEVLKIIEKKPLIGDRRSKTRWLVFFKEEV